MIRSLKNYSLNFLFCITRPQYLKLVLKSNSIKKKTIPRNIDINVIDEAIEKACMHLLLNQARSDEGGMASYYFQTGYSSSYPETTGYIAQSLLDAAPYFPELPLKKAALKACDWLLSIQKASGGWQGGYIHQNQDEVVFNTGQVIRGMTSAYLHTKQDKYLSAACRAADWLCSIQEPEGYWQKNVYLNTIRVYDTYVSAPLAQLGHITNNKKYLLAAEKNCLWVVRSKQQANGWFQDADNTLSHNDRPILHTIAYTLDGLIESHIYLQHEEILKGALLCADALVKIWNEKGVFHGRYNSQWIGSESTINTGCAQVSVALGRLYELTKKEIYLNTKSSIDNFLIQAQMKSEELPQIDGALSGSTPIWGRYEAFCAPNWATKYLIDALLFHIKNKE